MMTGLTDGAAGSGNIITNGSGSIVRIRYESQTGTISFYVVSDGSINGTSYLIIHYHVAPVTCSLCVILLVNISFKCDSIC